MNAQFYLNTRVLFILDRCKICKIWLEFIGIVNMNLPLDKQIETEEVSGFYDWGLTTPKISAYKKYLTHSYPVLFFEGMRLDLSASREELEAFVRTLVKDEFKIQSFLPYFEKMDCEYQKLPFVGQRLVCR